MSLSKIHSNFFAVAAIVMTLASSQGAFSMGQKAPKPTESDPAWVVQGVKGQRQEQPNWCWIAISRAVLSTKMSNLPSQCEMVSKALGKDCCSNGSVSYCNVPNYPSVVLDKYGVRTSAKQPDFNQVVAALKNKKLVMISQAVDSGGFGAHLVLAYGTYMQNGVYYLLVYEPYSGKSSQWTEKNLKAAAYGVFYVQ